MLKAKLIKTVLYLSLLCLNFSLNKFISLGCSQTQWPNTKQSKLNAEDINTPKTASYWNMKKKKKKKNTENMHCGTVPTQE
jgi:hypothetical protein